MIAYPDTSFLFAFYLRQSHSPAAAAYAASAGEPIHLTDLVRFEFRQSVRFQVWRNAAKRTEGVNLADAEAALSQLDEDLKNGIAVLHPCSVREVLTRADELSERHTIQGGHRSFDVLHVATALVLKAEKLLTFDENQRVLAKAAGLKVGP